MCNLCLTNQQILKNIFILSIDILLNTHYYKFCLSVISHPYVCEAIMEIDHHFILVISQCGSLTKAAQQLNISQPALTMRLNSIEEKLGFSIFDRRMSPVGITEPGKIYIEYLRKNEALLTEYMGRIYNILQDENSHLSIGGPSVYLETVVASAIKSLRMDHPDISVDLRIGSLSELIGQARQGLIDFFISTSEDLPREFKKVELGQEQLCICIPKGWSINGDLTDCQITKDHPGMCFDYSLLDGASFIGMEPNQPIQKKLIRFFDTFRITPKQLTTVNQVSCCLRFAAMGEGICLASREGIIPYLDSDELAFYPLPASFSERMIFLAYDEDHHLTQSCVRLIDILQNHRYYSENERMCLE